MEPRLSIPLADYLNEWTSTSSLKEDWIYARKTHSGNFPALERLGTNLFDQFDI